ncbi:MAG: hypothetical protein U0414_17095 [Polyangiaceae bacterium]
MFDPADAENVPVRARRGGNLLQAKLEPLSASSPFAHPNLFADFFGGKPVSPAP